MQCPKCGAVGQDGTECSVCGLVFAKYEKHQQQDHDIIYDDAGEASGLSRHINTLLLLIILVTGGFYFFGGGDEEQLAGSHRNPQTPAVATEAEGAASAQGEESVTAEVEVVAQENVASDSDSIAPAEEESAIASEPRRLLLPQETEQSPLERARSATVFISTALGSGSGFFVSEDCKIVTSRQLVNFDTEELNQHRLILAGLEERLGTLNTDISNRRDSFYQHCTDCSDTALQEFMGTMPSVRDATEQLIQTEQAAIDKLSAMQTIKVTLIDGSELDAKAHSISSDHDLALAIIPDASCPALGLTSLDKMKVKDKLFTIANAEGERHQLKPGRLSGTQTSNEIVYIQSSTPINAANRGGPLLNEEGSVVGVNTLLLENTQEIGLATPANYVIEAFELQGN